MKTYFTTAAFLARQCQTTRGIAPAMEEGPTILVADDNPDDALLLAEAFKKAGVSLTLQSAEDGLEAVNYLQGYGRYEDRSRFPFPTQFVVDFKLPCMSGLELLDWVRRQRFSQPLVVGVLSGSDYEPDTQKALAVGAEFCFAKPIKFEDLVGIARQLAEKCATALSA